MRDLHELNINEGGKPVSRLSPTTQQVHEFEERFGVLLPEEYIHLLQFSNGGHPELDSFKPVEAIEEDLWSVNRFYYLDDNKADLEGIWRATEVWQLATGKNIIPIANDGAGNQIVLSYDSNPPSVQICIHDENFYLLRVADTFEEFLDMLSTDPDMI